jgi:RecT family
MTMAVARQNATTTNTTTTTEPEPSTGLLAEILSRVDAIAVQQSRPSPMRLTTWAEIERFAERAAKSGMVPKQYQNPTDRDKSSLGADGIVIAVMMGYELGLAPMQALQNIAIVNGRPAVWGDALPGLCRASGVCRSIREWHEGEGDDLTFYCEAIRRDDPNPIVSSFSVADAKRANLWKETPKTKKTGQNGSYEVDSGPWYSYQRRMLQMRARGFCLRDAFPDVLKGLITAEEAGDIPFEATGLTPQPALRNNPDINAAPPATQAEPTNTTAAKKTVSQWLAEIEAEFNAALTAYDVDALCARDDVQKMLDRGSDMAKAALNAIVRRAIDRTQPDDLTSAPTDDADETFPGDIP